MAKLDQKLEEVHFRCNHCGFYFETTEPTVVDDPSTPWHPWAYFATCPKCGYEDIPERALYRNLRKAVKTERSTEGKAIVGRNLAGQSDPRRVAISRLNGMVHGAYADTVMFFPARPGSKWCDGCDVDEEICRSKPACMKNTELVTKYLIAMETQDPTLLRQNRAIMHARVEVIVSMMLQNIIQKGVMFEIPKYYIDKESGTPIFIHDLEGNPLKDHQINPLVDRLAFTLNKLGLTLPDSNMTERNSTAEEHLNGFLNGNRDDNVTALEYEQKMANSYDNLLNFMKKAEISREKDPILLESKDYSEDVEQSRANE